MSKIEASKPNLYSKQQNAYRTNRIQVANKAVPTFCAKEKSGKGFLVRAWKFLSLKELKRLSQKAKTLRQNNDETIKTISYRQDITLNI